MHGHTITAAIHIHHAHLTTPVTPPQVLDIQRAIHARLRRFTFEGTEMALKWSAW